MSGSDHLTISVAMCTRNGGRFVGAQLESILAQSITPQQIVISDDDSSDDTREIIEAIVASRPDIAFTVLSNSPPLGITANFERAVLATTSDLIALSDQDDLWTVDRLAVMLARFEADTELSLLFSDARLIDDVDSPIGSTLFEALEVTRAEVADIRMGRGYERLLRRNLATGATTVFRRGTLSAAVPFPASWVHDEWIAILAAALGKIDVIEEQLVDYRQHGENAIGAARPTLSEKMSRLSASRSARNARLVARAKDLVDRLATIPDLQPGLLETARRKLRHESMRACLPAARWRRLVPVLRAVLHGDYRAYSRGKRDILRDLVQPD